MTSNMKDLVVPVTVVMALLANAVMYGTDRGRSAQRLDDIDASLHEIKSAIGDGANKVDIVVRQQLEDAMDRRDLRRMIEQQQKDLWLLKDYTEGRISHLLYRKDH